MDWKTKLVLPPNYVTLQQLKELRTKEKAELELKLREEAEAEYKSRLEEEEEDRVKKLKEEEEEEEKRRTDEEKKMKEEEEERLRRESIKREQIIKTRTVLCVEPKFKKYSDDVKEIVTQVMIKDEDLKEEGKKKKNNRRWGKKKKDMERRGDALELEPQTLKPEIKSSEEEVIPDSKPKGNIYKNTRRRKSESKGGIVVDKIVMNQKVEEEIEKKIGDLNVDNYDKKMKSRAEKQFVPSQMKIDKKEHQFRIQNIQKHGIYVHNHRNASCSSLVWMPKEM